MYIHPRHASDEGLQNMEPESDDALRNNYSESERSQYQFGVKSVHLEQKVHLLYGSMVNVYTKTQEFFLNLCISCFGIS